MGIQLVDARNPVLTYMPKEKLEDQYVKKTWDLWYSLDGFMANRLPSSKMGQPNYILDADRLTVILNLVDKLRDEAMELSVRLVDD